MKLIFAFIIFITTSQAREVDWLYQSPNAILMGEAYQQMADDAYTLFYNPAIMGRHSGFSLNLGSVVGEVANVYDQRSKFENFPESDPVAITNRITGIPLSFRIGTAPGFKMGTLGVNMLANNGSSFAIQNSISPALEVNYKYDSGFVAGIGFEFGSGGSRRIKKKKGFSGAGKGWKNRVGFGLKHIKRAGLSGSFPIFGTTLLNKITSSGAKNYKDIRAELGYSIGRAWGYDAGWDTTYTSKFSQFSFGFAALDIGGMKFDEYQGIEDVPNQRTKFNFGSSFRQDFGLFGYALTFDFKPMNYSELPIERKLHFGFMLDLPLIDLMYGINEGYPSYGFAIDILIFKLTAGVYGVELGTKYKEIKGSRAFIALHLFEFSLDP